MAEDKTLLAGLEERRDIAKELLERCEKLNTCVEGQQKLKRKVKSEISFLDSLHTKQVQVKASHVQSTNLPHLQGVIKTAEQAEGIVAFFRTFSFTSSEGSTVSCIVDIVAANGSSWIKIIARNPKALHRIWQGQGQYGDRDLMEQAESFIECSKNYVIHFKNPSITFLFCNGVTEGLAKSLVDLGISVQGDVLVDPGSELDLTSSTSPMCEPAVQEPLCITLVNVDVSTMIAFVSALTNGGSMFVFKDSILNTQAEKERKNSLLPQVVKYFSDKELIACTSAINDFNKIIQTIGGPNEKQRASQLLDRLREVPDEPSQRTLRLNNSASIKLRSKVIFGTGDMLKAVTITANSSFVRAANSQGVNFSVFLHDSRALTESKQSQATPIKPL